MSRRLAARAGAACALVCAAWLGACSSTPSVPADSAWVAEVEAWRADREERLRGEESWLTLVGLHWLEPGDSTFGTASDNTIVFPEGSAPEHAGVLHYDGEHVTIEAAAGVPITVNDEPVTSHELADDGAGTGRPDRVRVGRLLCYVIRRDDRRALRVKDPESPVRLAFHGLNWYPIDPRWRVEGTLHRYPTPHEIDVATVVGTTAHQYVPGEVTFRIDGHDESLIPLLDTPDDTHFFFIFRDRTSGHETYAAGRYMYGDLVGDRVVLDFNEAYNPPCIFTHFATCTLPPPGNTLEIAVTAGEKLYDGTH